MDNPVHNRRTAVYAVTENRRISPSFYAALGVALAVHAGLAWYLVQQNFGGTLIEGPRLPEGPTIIIEMPPPAKPETPPAKPVIQVHKPAGPVTTVETTPLTPVETKTAPTEIKVLDLPTEPQATSQSSSSDAGPAFVTARWTRFPDGAALAYYYPPRAEADEVEGSATVQCTVLDTAGRVSCITVAEKPGGYGFGKATARMVEEKGRVDTTQGNVRVGSILRQTVVWKLD